MPTNKRAHPSGSQEVTSIGSLEQIDMVDDPELLSLEHGDQRASFVL